MKDKWIRTILSGCIFIIFFYFFSQALLTAPFEFDSISYHIPLAKSILNGQILHPERLTIPNSAFPAATELILAILIAVHIPLNMFNVIAWSILSYVLFLLGKQYKLKNYNIIFILSIITLPTVIRLLLTQTADLWLVVFFAWLMFLFHKPQNRLIYFLKAGLAAGLLIGSKYSGPLYFIALILVYRKKILSYLTYKGFVLFLIPFFIFGLSWYVRNIIIFSNPFYPAPFLWMKGLSVFSPDVFLSHFRMIVAVKNGLLFTINAWLSEYLFWPFIIAFGLWITYKVSKQKMLSEENIALFTLTIIGVIIYLIIPGYPYNYNNYVSEIRYSIPVIITFILLFYNYVRKTVLIRCMPICVFLNLIAIFTLFIKGGYHPKIIVIIAVASFSFLVIYLRTKSKL